MTQVAHETGTEAVPRPRPATAHERLTPAERVELGKAARARVPRDSHAAFGRPAGRPDPISLLEQQSASRVPSLVPVRYGRMVVSPFTYYRGGALPMASDLADTPATGLTVQACGDAHLSNFGVFGSPERRLVFDVNDFDETLPGPWEWDVKRLAASLEVAARGNEFSRSERTAVVMATVRRYRAAMRRFAGMSNLDVWYSQADVEGARAQFEYQLSKRQRKAWGKGEAKARTSDSMRALQKLCRTVDGEPRIIADPPLIVPIEDLAADADAAGVEAQLRTLITKYGRTLETDRRSLLEQYQFTDIARKVVGVGSVGTRCWIVLMLGRDDSDPLFLQVKEAEASVLSRFTSASKYANQGQRVVAGQRLMQAASDIFLGWIRIDAGLDGKSRDFYVRQLRDWKFSLEIADMVPDGMRMYGELCGWTLARAHARSGDRIAIAAYLGGSDMFDRAITEFASAYADQNERDYEALREAAASGRITAHSDLLPRSPGTFRWPGRMPYPAVSHRGAGPLVALCAAPPHGRPVGGNQPGDQRRQENLADERFHHGYRPAAGGGGGEVAVADGCQRSETEVLERLDAARPPVREKCAASELADRRVAGRKHQSDDHVGADGAEDALQRDLVPRDQHLLHDKDDRDQEHEGHPQVRDSRARRGRHSEREHQGDYRPTDRDGDHDPSDPVAEPAGSHGEQRHHEKQCDLDRPDPVPGDECRQQVDSHQHGKKEAEAGFIPIRCKCPTARTAPAGQVGDRTRHRVPSVGSDASQQPRRPDSVTPQGRFCRRIRDATFTRPG